MHIESFKEVINACRFCFMCRHLSAAANARFRESDAPRGRALIADAVRMDPGRLAESDFADAFYDSDLSGANRFHCVSGYDEIGLQLAFRRDLVDAGREPERVKALSEELRGTARWIVEGKGDALYFIDPATAARPASVDALARVARAGGVPLATVRGGCIGKGLAVLGYADAAKEAMARFAQVVNAAGAKTLVVSNPAAYDALAVDFPANGAILKPAVLHASAFMAGLARDGAVRFAAKPEPISYLESDYLRNYARCDGPGEFFRALGLATRPFGTNNEESYTAGEGALALDRLNPGLARKLAERVAGLAEEGVRVATASAWTARVLAEAGLATVTLEELAGERLCS